MQIINGEYPPNYAEITRVFNIEKRSNIVFTYGNTLYVPGGQKIDSQLLKHEETHARQQLEMGVDEWWDRYLTDEGFRFTQELEAYRNQYKAMASLPLKDRIGYLDHICTDLAGEMYGNLVTKEEAKAEITKGIILKHVGPKHSKLRQLRKRQRNNKRKGRK